MARIDSLGRRFVCPNTKCSFEGTNGRALGAHYVAKPSHRPNMDWYRERWRQQKAKWYRDNKGAVATSRQRKRTNGALPAIAALPTVKVDASGVLTAPQPLPFCVMCGKPTGKAWMFCGRCGGKVVRA